MSLIRRLHTLGLLVLLITLGYSTASAQQIKTVFIIAMENHNWTQPTQPTESPAGIQQIYRKSQRAVH